MKKIIIMLIFRLLASQMVQAQGTMTYLSNLGQPPVGSKAVGSDTWLAAMFTTGGNADGYTLDAIQLEMADASGSPSNFMVTLYSVSFGGAISPGTNLVTLDGSLDPAIGGIYTFTAVSNFVLSPLKAYYIVVTAGTTIANGAYEQSHVGTNSYNPSGGWGSHGGIWASSSGSTWNEEAGNPRFAIDAIAIPEPGVFGLLGLGGLAFLWHRRKAKAL